MVDWGDEAEEPGEKWADSEGGEEIPGEENDDTSLGGGAFFPGDARMEEITEECGEKVGDNGGDPEEIIVFENEVSHKSVDKKIGGSESETDDDVLGEVVVGFGWTARFF